MTQKGYAETRIAGSPPPKYGHIKEPLKEVLAVLAGIRPPFKMVGVCHSNEMDEVEAADLEEWCAMNAKPAWATGRGILEAAELIVELAIENANI